MNKYTIFCTAEQTKKAFELGAPLNTWGFARELVIPTAEQMISWLEEQGFVIEIILSGEEHPWTFVINNEEDVCVYDTRKEATLAAIDAALDYLTAQSLNKLR